MSTQNTTNAPSELVAWVRTLDQAYLIGWANRGLLRRGSRLSETVDSTEAIESDPGGGGGYRATLEGYRQRVDAPAFTALCCSCPAAGPCHHLIAFVLCLQDYLKDSERNVGDAPSPTPPPWLDEDSGELIKTLGRAYLKRAQRWVLERWPCELSLTASTLSLTMAGAKSDIVVRIPRAGGVRASLCSCGATPRCVHRALAVVLAREQAGSQPLPIDEDETIDGLDASQSDVLEQVQEWLYGYVDGGSTALGQPTLDRGSVLATWVRQADLPAVALDIERLVGVMRDELAVRSFLQGGELAQATARLWRRVRALRSRPLPRPKIELAGSHRRAYRRLSTLELRVVDIEQWESAREYLGFTVHLYAPATGCWYRHVQARPRELAHSSGWSPERVIDESVWANTVAYQDIADRVLRVDHGWVSDDGQISGRDGTRLVLLPDDHTIARSALAEEDFSGIAARLRERLENDEDETTVAQPALIAIARADAPYYDDASQRWSWRVYDTQDQALEVVVVVTSTFEQRIVRRLQRRLARRTRIEQVFGLARIEHARIQLRPIALAACRDESKSPPVQAEWINLTRAAD